MNLNGWRGGSLIARKEGGICRGTIPQGIRSSNPAVRIPGLLQTAQPGSTEPDSGIVPANRSYNNPIAAPLGSFMNVCRRIGLSAALVFVALFASAAVKSGTIRITVVDSETRSFPADDNGVPRNCDQVNYDAYCHSGKTAEIINTLLVQEGNAPPFRITCTIDSKWSRFIPLPKGESFDARRERHGLVIYYEDDNGKARGQLYTYVAAQAEDTPAPPAVATGARPTPAPAENTTAATEVPNSPPAAVKCSLTSTPSGAEIELDGRFVGSTPSVLSLTGGQHVVVISLPGFAQWKRDLTVSPGSELTVNAVLEKAR